MSKYDFSGWATRNDLLCGDGRTIRKDAFKDNDGQTVPLVWNHDHQNLESVIGHALLENREDGVYAYCTLNDSELAESAKTRIHHGDLRSLSIYANKLKQVGKDVVHGSIRELSLVLAGANPGAYIDFIMAHGDEEGESFEANYDECCITIYHSDNEVKEEPEMAEEKKELSVQERMDKISEKVGEEDTKFIYGVIGAAYEDGKKSATEDKDEEKEEGDSKDMKHSIFETDQKNDVNVISHSDEEAILSMAKEKGVGDLQSALKLWSKNNSIEHADLDAAIERTDATGNYAMNVDALFPEYKLISPLAPKIMWDDDSWVAGVINGVGKSPYSRVRTRMADARKSTLEKELQAKGHTKGKEKKLMDGIKLLGRSHDAQMIYIKDRLNREDILQITDFDMVAYQWNIMKHVMEQTIAQAILFGDGRSDIDPDKIKEDRIRPVWKDDEFYCLHQDIDIAKAKQELQGTNTGANFGENYIYAEAVITAALYSREKYKGSGSPVFYCTPHLLNVMLLARDLNGRRIYNTKADLVAALNVKDIKTIEQMDDLKRETSDNKTKKLLGLFVNLADYQLGCVKGGQITRFNQFNMNFNQEELMMETFLSGALIEPASAIALEEDVTSKASGSAA